MSTSQPKSTTLNPSATEFVPSFALPQTVTTNNGSNGGGGYVNNQYNQRNQHYNNHNNNYHHNNRSNNNYNNNNHQYRNQNNNNSYYSNNGTYFNPNDVDPIEIEARCEAVIEILQDDNIRDQLNPSSRIEPTPITNNSNNHHNNHNNNNYCYDDNQEPPCDDEEEMLEMMAMQEECRLEMMKFYIQSQNPSLFEEIYHDVSYPDAVKKPTEELRDPIVKPVVVNPDVKAEQPVPETTNKTDEKNDKSNSTTTENTELKDLIINHLNPDAYEFIPSKFSNLKLNDDSDLNENKTN